MSAAAEVRQLQFEAKQRMAVMQEELQTKIFIMVCESALRPRKTVVSRVVEMKQIEGETAEDDTSKKTKDSL